MIVKAAAARPQPTDATTREKLVAKLRELADCYGELAEAAMARDDRHGVYECVKLEREAHNRAHRVEKGHIRF